MPVKEVKLSEGISGDDMVCTLQPFEVLKIINSQPGTYEPSYVPTYIPEEYTPSYTPTVYNPTYTPEYTPTYNPTEEENTEGVNIFKWIVDVFRWILGIFGIKI